MEKMSYEDAQNLYAKENQEEMKKYGKDLVHFNYKLYCDINVPSVMDENSWTNVVPMSQIERSDRIEKGPYRCRVTFPNELNTNVQFNSIDEDSANLLTALVRAFRPRVLLETGTHKGRSTRAIAEGIVSNGFGHLWTLDRTDHNIKTSGALIGKQAEVVTPCFGSSPEALNEDPLKDLKDIEFAFLDSVHSKEGVLEELKWLESHCAEECLVVVDNARDSGWPGIMDLFKDYSVHQHINIPTMTGFELIQMRKKCDNPSSE